MYCRMSVYIYIDIQYIIYTKLYLNSTVSTVLLLYSVLVHMMSIITTILLRPSSHYQASDTVRKNGPYHM